MTTSYMSHHHAEYAAVMEALKTELFTEEPQMFNYKSEAIAYSITAENAEMRESLLKQELLATQITMENLRVVTPKMRGAAMAADMKWDGSGEMEHIDAVYIAMLEAA